MHQVQSSDIFNTATTEVWQTDCQGQIAQIAAPTQKPTTVTTLQGFLIGSEDKRDAIAAF